MAKYDPNGNPIGKGKGKSYGQETNNRIRSRRQHLQNASSEKFDFSTISPEFLLHLLSIVVKAGGAVRIGASRDGGALAIGYYYKEDSWTEYIRPQEDLQAYLENAIADWLEECQASGVEI